ncbi:MAG: hypothetical protein HYV09_20210 [Deltaproteobacteria bacterium]|nr:hypothetical protein [Deltaproteobacteria bacterium]
MHRSPVITLVAVASLFALGCPPQPQYGGGGGGRAITGDPDPDGANRFAAGHRVRCHWKNGSTTYEGTVTGVEDGRLLIDYDDGDREAITPSLCQPIGGGAAPVASSGGALGGTWSIVSSSNPGGGGGYTGTVSILRTGEPYQLTWSIPGSSGFSGVGVDMGSVLAVGWSPSGGSFGVVAYRVQGGQLDGVWAMQGQSGALGVERLSGPPGLAGTYTITEARTPTGGTYSGTVQITPAGQVYRLQWTLANETYAGVGILQGDVLSVGWGSASVGVVAYRVQGGMLDGTWATLDGTTLGTEVLSRP